MLALLGASLLLTGSPVARAPTDVRAAVERVYRGADYQKELPGVEAPNGSAEAERATAEAAWWDIDLGPLGEIVALLLRVGAAAGAILGILWVARALSRRGAREPGAQSEGGGAALELGERPLLDAEALAREARFAEAIHMLLLRTFEHLVRSGGATLSPAWTSREVLARVSVRDEARGALGELVAAVERCWFAGATPSEDDYRRCVGRFRAFSAALSRAAA